MDERVASKRRPEGKKQKPGEHPHVLEWAVGAVSAVLVLAMIGFVLYQAVSVTSARPELHVVAETVEPAGAGFQVPFRAVNRGDSTAAGVNVEGRIERDGETVETSGVTLDYVPAHSEQRGGLFFREDPRQGRLVLEVKGYADP